MKTQFKSHTAQGSTFIACLCVAIVTGILLASYLSLTHYQFASVVRSEYWNRAITVSEAGVEDGLQLINKYSTYPGRLDEWSLVSSYTADNWTLVSNNLYHVNRTIDSDSYDSYVITTGATPVVIATATISLPYAFAVAAADLPNQPTLARQITVGTGRDPLFSVAMAARNNIDLNGKTIHTDSFDSRSDLYSSNHLYVADRALAGGDVVTDGQLTDTLNLGNAIINGKVKTGPDGTITIGDNGSVGDQTWTASHPGQIQDGWSSQDMNVTFDSVVMPDEYKTAPYVPFYTWTNPVTGIVYTRTILTSGKYQTDNLNGTVYIPPGVEVGIWVHNGYDQGGSEVIDLGFDPSTEASGKLTMYSDGNIKIAGNGINNPGGLAQNLILYGLPSCTLIQLQGNGSFIGVIYAPDAFVVLGGGGSDEIDFIGSCIAKSVKMNGKFNFHFDEALRQYGPARGFIPTWWQETKAN